MAAARWCAVVALLLAACGSGGSSSPTGTTTPKATTPGAGPYRVVKVVDGDTIKVATPDPVTVRVIGIDTPETVDPRKPVECFGLEASARAHDLLDDTSVTIESDPTQDETDRYGRTLAYVWMEDGRLFNEVMIAEGYAFEYTYDLPYVHQEQFDAAEREARTGERGLWAPGVCE